MWISFVVPVTNELNWGNGFRKSKPSPTSVTTMRTSDLTNQYITSNYNNQQTHIKYFINEYLDCCVGTWKPLYFTFPVDDALELKHVRISYVMYDF